MRELIQENTGAVIGVVVCLGLVAVVGVLMATGGPVQTAFANMINKVLQAAGAAGI